MYADALLNLVIQMALKRLMVEVGYLMLDATLDEADAGGAPMLMPILLA